MIMKVIAFKCESIELSKIKTGKLRVITYLKSNQVDHFWKTSILRQQMVINTCEVQQYKTACYLAIVKLPRKAVINFIEASITLNKIMFKI